MTGVLHTPSTTARLTAAMDVAPLHLQPILRAVRDHRVGLLIASQGSGVFAIPDKPKRRSAVVILGDDMAQSRGAGGFHMPSVRLAIRACRTFAVVSSAASPSVYGVLGNAAVGGRNAMIVETRLEHEFRWVALIRKLAPQCPLIISTIKGGEA